MGDESKDLSEIAILPCLCGGSASLIDGFDVDCESSTAEVCCDECGSSSGEIYPNTIDDVRKLVEQWNTRMELCNSENEDLKELAFSLGYAWPEDAEGRWQCLRKMARMAAHWRAESEKYRTETLMEVERQKLYSHQKSRLIAMTRKVANLRRALRQFMADQVAWIREAKEEK